MCVCGGGGGPRNCLSTSIIMACVLLQQCSQYIVLHLAVAQFVTRLCIDI